MPKEKDLMCDHCGHFKARRTDYRTIDGITTKYNSCTFCFEIDTKTLIGIRKFKLNPLELESEYINFSLIEHEILQEISDSYQDKIEAYLAGTKSKHYLTILLEAERQLTLKEEDAK